MMRSPTEEPRRYQVFLGSSKLITKSSSLWKYLTFEKLCWLLEEAKLYHTRLDQFADPFEGAVTNTYATQRDTGKIRPYFSLPEWEPFNFKLSRFTNYATCWHASEHESDALWQLYARGGAGIAVVSTMERLQKSVNLNPNCGILGQVEYADFDTHLMRRPNATAIRPGLLKRISFEHEKEVRGLTIANQCDLNGSMDDAFLEKMRVQMPVGFEAQVELSELIQAIVISPLAKPFVEKLVRKACARLGIERLVRKSNLNGTPVY